MWIYLEYMLKVSLQMHQEHDTQHQDRGTLTNRMNSSDMQVQGMKLKPCDIFKVLEEQKNTEFLHAYP